MSTQFEFKDRKVKFKEIKVLDANEETVESFYASISDVVEEGEEGTPLNAENLNAMKNGIKSELKDELKEYLQEDTSDENNDQLSSEMNFKKIVCTGDTTNQEISDVVNLFFNDSNYSDNATLTLKIVGDVNITDEPIAGDINSKTNPARFFDLGVQGYTGNKRVVIDWSEANISEKNYLITPNQWASCFNVAFVYNACKGITHLGLKVKFTFQVVSTSFTDVYGTVATAIRGDYIEVVGGEIEVTSIGTWSGQSGSGGAEGINSNNSKIEDCTVMATHVGRGRAVAYVGNNNEYIDCTAEVTSNSGADYGFYTNYSTHKQCKSTATHGEVIYGYRGNCNHYVSCEANATNSEINTSISHGFMGESNDYDRCTSKASNKYGYGYSGVSNRYTYCTALGIGNANGTDNGTGVGIMGANSMVLGCTLMGYDEDGLSVFGYKSKSGSEGSYHMIRDCVFKRVVSDNHDGTNGRAIYIDDASLSQAYVIEGNLIDKDIVEISGKEPNDVNYLYRSNVHTLALTQTLG